MAMQEATSLNFMSRMVMTNLFHSRNPPFKLTTSFIPDFCKMLAAIATQTSSTL